MLPFFFLLLLIPNTKALSQGDTLLSPDKTFQLSFFKDHLSLDFIKSNPPLQIWTFSQPTSLLNPNFSLQLTNKGNLLVKSHNNTLLWQSFQHPQSVMLPGMKLTSSGLSLSTGPFSLKVDFNGSLSLPPRLLLYNGSSILYSAGHFNGLRFTGVPSMQINPFLRYFVMENSTEAQFWFEITGKSMSLIQLGEDGVARRLKYEENLGYFRVFTNSPADECDRFGNCGNFGLCNMSNFPVCGCMADGDWTRGCARQNPMDCHGRDGFLKFERLKLPHLVDVKINRELGLGECRERCEKDCSCNAFAAASVMDVAKEGCITWHGDILDVRVLDTKVQDLFVRVPKSYLEKKQDQNAKSKRKLVLIAVLLVLLPGISLAFISIFLFRRGENIKPEEDKESALLRLALDENDDDLMFFPAQIVASATSNFSNDNKIGEGGFGVVFKGILPDGQEVAVKRLTNLSVESQVEFTNEVKSLAKLKHKNLVQLIGCCIDGRDKMLIFEFMKNKSLDAFIFDEQRRALLGWRTRLDIVLGIARGLEYLHHDSGSRIIHRDLKAWNILLDEAMVPKISDFGTARIFSSDQMLAKTRKIIGTYGYMSPEYAIKGIISMKSDVFSFGVLTLEIMSGIRNCSLYVNDFRESLLSKAWRLWKEGNFMELLDQSVCDKCPIAEVLRCVHVALLCVEEKAEDRPTMASVAMMLSTETFPLPKPRKPGFVVLRNSKEAPVSSSNEPQKYTGNGMTQTELVGR